MTFDEWYAGQADWLNNESVCRAIWNASAKAQQDEIEKLRAQVAHLPAQRTSRIEKRTHPDYPGSGMADTDFYRIKLETEEEFRAFGKPYTEVVE